MTLRAKTGDNEHTPCVISCDEKCGQTYVHYNMGNTLAARDYKQPQCVAYGFDQGATRDVGKLFLEEKAKTVSNGTCPGHHNGVVTYGINFFCVHCFSPFGASQVFAWVYSYLFCFGIMQSLLDRASFNQGKNAQYDFSVEEELAPTLVAKGAGGGY